MKSCGAETASGIPQSQNNWRVTGHPRAARTRMAMSATREDAPAVVRHRGAQGRKGVGTHFTLDKMNQIGYSLIRPLHLNNGHGGSGAPCRRAFPLPR